MKNSKQHFGNEANVTLQKNINLVPKATFPLSHDFIFLKTSPLLGRCLVSFNLQSAICGLQFANVIHRFHWQLFALSTLSFSVSIKNFGFTVSTPFFLLKNVFRNCRMSEMHVNHSLVVVDLEKILQCGSAESKTAKLDQTG